MCRHLKRNRIPLIAKEDSNGTVKSGNAFVPEVSNGTIGISSAQSQSLSVKEDSNGTTRSRNASVPEDSSGTIGKSNASVLEVKSGIMTRISALLLKRR
jgi:hypothetical protein